MATKKAAKAAKGAAVEPVDLAKGKGAVTRDEFEQLRGQFRALLVNLKRHGFNVAHGEAFVEQETDQDKARASANSSTHGRLLPKASVDRARDTAGNKSPNHRAIKG